MNPATETLINPASTSPAFTPPPWKKHPARILFALALTAVLLSIAGIWAWKSRGANRIAPQSKSSVSPVGWTTVRLNGKTEAVRSRAILAPVLAGQQFQSLTIVKLIPSGSRVKVGDPLVEFDRQAQVRDFIDKQAQSQDQNGKVLEAQAAERAASAKDETEIQQAQSALSKAELEMKKVELLSRIDAEKARQDLDEAHATLAQLKETFDLKRKAAQASIRILEIQRDRTREAMLHAQANAALLQIRSPIEGVVVFYTIWKQGNMGEVQEGDQVRPGVAFMQVVDPSVMQVRALVNQQDLIGLHVGQAARIRLDAYPEMEMEGELGTLDPMGQKGDFSSKLRRFTALFSIKGNDPRLMPDLSASVDVNLASQRDSESGAR